MGSVGSVSRYLSCLCDFPTGSRQNGVQEVAAPNVRQSDEAAVTKGVNQPTLSVLSEGEPVDVSDNFKVCWCFEPDEWWPDRNADGASSLMSGGLTGTPINA